MARSILLLFAVTVAVVVVAIKLLPWWAIPLLFIGLAVGLVGFAKWGLKRLLLMPFKAKGAVLRDADVQVHAIERAGALEPDPDTDPETIPAPMGPCECYRLDVTISPKPPSGRFRLWEPGELLLVGPNAKPDDPDADDACEVRQVEVKHNGRFEPDEGMKYEGRQRLRLLLATAPGVHQLRFRYYLELFGRVSLP